jgi:hypothetical protein
MAKKTSWQAAATKKQGHIQACGAAIELEKYPALAEILLGWEDSDGSKHAGGSLVIFYGNTGTLTVMACPKGCENNFFTEIVDLDYFFGNLNEALLTGKGSWRPRREEPKRK